MGDNALFFKKNLKAVMVTRSVVFVFLEMDNDVFDINLLGINRL